jgi:hypothetical protein
MHVIAHGSRDADAAGRAFGLQTSRHVHRVAVEVSAIGNCVAKVDPYAEADRPISGLIGIVNWKLLLNFDPAAHRPVNAVEHDEQGIPAGLNDLPAVLLYGWIDHLSAKGA